MIEDWVMDSNLFDIKSSYERNLLIHLMEKLWVSPEETKLLLIVSADNNFELFGSKKIAMNSQQKIEEKSIRGKMYYRLQCTIITSNCNQLIHGVNNKTYM